MDQDVYIPTPLQKKVSVDGYDLLRNMAIPQLDIDAITNETTVKGKAVTFLSIIILLQTHMMSSNCLLATS